MTTLILIRHGVTDWNLEGRYSGQSDVPLNTQGREQALAVSTRLEGETIDAIYSSDLMRARQTAETLIRNRSVPLYLDPRLREIHQGDWEGMLFAEIQARYAEAWKTRKNDPLSVAPPGGETVGKLRQRVLAAIRDILQAHPQGTVAVVSHGLSLAIIRAHIASVPIEKVWDYIPSNAHPEWFMVEKL
ncbi:MAG: alpha-ribazole phosphatase [Anaerolineales bacterium]|nr:alpha-ribazole phosphatase [Anaerolineales bacterium]